VLLRHRQQQETRRGGELSTARELPSPCWPNRSVPFRLQAPGLALLQVRLLHQPLPLEEPSEPPARDAAAAAPIRGPAAIAAAADRLPAVMIDRLTD
jgi:hypothetical protein